MSELSIFTAFASALMSGVFLAFSSFVMTALGNIQFAEGIRAMQRINIDVFSWSFSLLFFSIPVMATILGVYGVTNWQEPGSYYYLLGSLIYLIGCLLVTAKGNVPLNNQLARIDADEPEAELTWRKYCSSWTRWNHLRTLSCLLASIFFMGIGVVF